MDNEPTDSMLDDPLYRETEEYDEEEAADDPCVDDGYGDY